MPFAHAWSFVFKATTMVTGLNRPTYIQTIRIIFPAGERYGVIPTLTPTVPVAEQLSNSKSKKVWW